MKIRKITIFFVLAGLVGMAIALENLLPVMLSDCVVQDDFRQSQFIWWRFWDRGLFQGSLSMRMYGEAWRRSPAIYLLYRGGSLLADGPVSLSKAVSLLVSVFGSLAAFFYMRTLTGENRFALSFCVLISCMFWCTDHVSAAQARSFAWLGLLVYMYAKESARHQTASLICLVLLFIHPVTFLLCMGIEAFSVVFSLWKEFPGAGELSCVSGIWSRLKGMWDCRRESILIDAVSLAVTALMHLVLLPRLSSVPSGTMFSLEELRRLPEFNPGGRHPIFGGTFWDGTWWTNQHWGLGVGYLKVSWLMPVAVFGGLIWFLTVRPGKKEVITLLNSTAGKLFSSSLILYFVAQVTFPMIYLPSRYIGVPWLMISAVIICLLAREARLGIARKKMITRGAAGMAPFAVALCFWLVLRNWYHPRFVSITPQIKEAVEQLPEDSVIAGHPDLPDISTIPVTTGRMVYVDRERSVSRNREILSEIRRRTLRAFGITYASTLEGVVEQAREEGITHLLVHRFLYSPAYLDNPVYLEPYNERLKQLVSKDAGREFALRQFLESKGIDYALFSISEIRAELAQTLPDADA